MPLSDFWIGMDLPCFRNTPVSFFDKSVKAEPAMAVFRKVFHLADVPKELTARFSGDCKYRLWINGQFVDDGPVEIGGDYANTTAPDWWFHDSRDVAKYCRAGDNVIVAEVLNTGDAQTDYSCGITAFTLELAGLLHTDGGWKCFRNPAFRGSCFFDASRFCEDYHSPEFDDSAWEFAFELPAADRGRWKLTELDLPPLSEETVYPVECIVPFAEIENPDALLSADDSAMTIPAGPPACFYLRFAEETVGPKAVMEHLRREFGLDCDFADLPTGL